MATYSWSWSRKKKNFGSATLIKKNSKVLWSKQTSSKTLFVKLFFNLKKVCPTIFHVQDWLTVSTPDQCHSIFKPGNFASVFWTTGPLWKPVTVDRYSNCYSVTCTARLAGTPGLLAATEFRNPKNFLTECKCFKTVKWATAISIVRNKRVSQQCCNKQIPEAEANPEDWLEALERQAASWPVSSGVASGLPQ